MEKHLATCQVGKSDVRPFGLVLQTVTDFNEAKKDNIY